MSHALVGLLGLAVARRQDDVEVSWQLLTPVLQAWEQDESAPHIYPAGCESFPQADKLLEADGRKWRRLLQG